QDRSGRVSLDGSGGTVTFDSDYPIGSELIVATNLPAANHAAGIATDGNPRGKSWSRDRLASPAAANIASDVAPRPRKRHHRGRRRLVNRATHISSIRGRNRH